MVAHVINHLVHFTKKVPTIEYFLIKYSSTVDDKSLRHFFKNTLFLNIKKTTVDSVVLCQWSVPKRYDKIIWKLIQGKNWAKSLNMFRFLQLHFWISSIWMHEIPCKRNCLDYINYIHWKIKIPILNQNFWWQYL